MPRSSLFALVLPLSLVACAVQSAPDGADPSAVAPPADTAAPEARTSATLTAAPATAQPQAARVPFCLPGEKVSCTLGPPPVCRCVPATPPPVLTLEP